jgi:hypothetical protein
MADDTEVREAKKQGFLARHMTKVLIGILTAGGTGAGSLGLDMLGDIRTELADLKQTSALQAAEISSLRQESMDHIWRTLYIHEGQIEANTIEVGALERYIALASSEGNITSEDTQAMFEALRELVEEEEFEFTAEQIEGFRNVQQKMDYPQQKK